MSIARLIQSDSVGIIGICKNAGKTTVLNSIIRGMFAVPNTDKTPLGLTSIGRDGESTDVVTHTPKPRVYVRENTLIATACGVLKHCDITRQILQTTGISTPLGEVVILRAKSDGYIELAGPSTTSGLDRACRSMRDFGAKLTVIDGAISRKAFSVQSLCREVILCAGASYDNSMSNVIDATVYSASLLMLPKYKQVFTHNREIAAKFIVKLASGMYEYVDDVVQLTETVASCRSGGERVVAVKINGAVTDSAVTPLIRNDVRDIRLIAADAGNILIGHVTFEKLKMRDIQLCVENSSKLLAVAINPYSARGASFDARMFMDKARESLRPLGLSVYNVLEKGL